MGERVGDNVSELLRELIDTFEEYVFATVDIDAADFEEDTPEVGFEILGPQGQMEVEEISLEEAEAIVEAMNNAEFSYHEVVISMDYSVYYDMWSIVFSPMKTYGFEVMCKDLAGGLVQATKLLRAQMALIDGDVSEYVKDLDEELEQFLKFETEGKQDG